MSGPRSQAGTLAVLAFDHRVGLDNKRGTGPETNTQTKFLLNPKGLELNLGLKPDNVNRVVWPYACVCDKQDEQVEGNYDKVWLTFI